MGKREKLVDLVVKLIVVETSGGIPSSNSSENSPNHHLLATACKVSPCLITFHTTDSTSFYSESLCLAHHRLVETVKETEIAIMTAPTVDLGPALALLHPNPPAQNG